jgi:hypothetical protein
MADTSTPYPFKKGDLVKIAIRKTHTGPVIEHRYAEVIANLGYDGLTPTVVDVCGLVANVWHKDLELFDDPRHPLWRNAQERKDAGL